MMIVLHERDYAEQLLNSTDLGAHPTDTLIRIAKLCLSNGCPPNEVRKILEKHILKCEQGANLILWREIIERSIRFAKKYPFVELECIPIYKHELEICNGLEGVQTRRLMFTLICLARYGNMVNANNNNWVNRQEKDILALANLKVSVKRRSLMFNSLYTLGLIGYSRRVDNLNTSVKCLSDESDEVAMEITDFRNLGYQYMRATGIVSIECAMCGAVVPKKCNRQMYCAECADEVNRLKTNERYHKHYASS